MSTLNGLTDKQKVFVTEYLKCWNGAEAARRAGYAFPTRSAYENLTNPDIRRVVDAELSLKAMEADELLWRLGEKARFDVSEYLVSESGEHILDVDALKADGKGHLIRDITNTRYGQNIKLASPDDAQQLIGKHLGLFTDRTENLNIDLSNLTNDQLKRIANGESPLDVLASPSESGA